MIKFSIKIDDENHSLSKENGIPINEIAPLLESLFKAIDTGSGEKLTLGQVRGNCYALDFFSEDTGYLANFTVVHKNIQEVSLDELQPEQQRYASNLKAVLGDKYFLTAYDNDNKEFATIANIEQASSIQLYYTTDTIYGVVSELGSGNNLSARRKHIYVDGFSSRISISKEQDAALKNLYGSHRLRLEIRQKRAIADGRIIGCELEEFVILSENNLLDNIKNEGYIDFELIKDTHTIDDILNRIYAIR
jgi:hypothetical protein